MSNKRHILILGANSFIAQETAKNFAKNGSDFYLVSRDSEKLEEIKKDLLVRGAGNVQIESLEIASTLNHESFFDNLTSNFTELDTVLIAYGSLADQEKAQADAELSLQEIGINYTSVVSILTLLANYFEKKSYGTIAVISSVAGDRGRKKNYVYGSAKAGLSVFLEGLRNRFGKSDIKVLTIKPGFVDTPMTKDFKKGLLFASAENVGLDIFEAIEKGRDVIYTPFFWRYIMLIIKMIPECIFKKLNI